MPRVTRGPPRVEHPPLVRRREARWDGRREDAADRARWRRGDEEDAGVVVPVYDEMGLVRVVRFHFRLRGRRRVRDREDPEERRRGGGGGGCRRGRRMRGWRRRRVGGVRGLAGEVEGFPEVHRLRRWHGPQAPLRLSLVHEE